MPSVHYLDILQWFYIFLKLISMGKNINHYVDLPVSTSKAVYMFFGEIDKINTMAKYYLSKPIT